MSKVIHKSWYTAAAGRAGARPAVEYDFEGLFSEGSLEGTMFAGRIRFDEAAVPSEQHVSFALYEGRRSPVVTMVVGGHVMAASGAAVYDSVFDGTAKHYDFVTMYGTGPVNGIPDGAYFELYFADQDGATLDGTHMPTAQQLCDMPVKQVSFGSSAPGDVLSVGTMHLIAAH